MNTKQFFLVVSVCMALNGKLSAAYDPLLALISFLYPDAHNYRCTAIIVQTIIVLIINLNS